MGVLLLVCVLTAVPELQEWCDLKRWQLDAELLGVAHGMGRSLLWAAGSEAVRAVGLRAAPALSRESSLSFPVGILLLWG